MRINFYFDGLKQHTSSKGTVYADLYVRSICEDGTPDFEQDKLRTFSEEVIKVCSGLKAGDIVNLDLSIKDAFINDASV